MDFFLRGLCPLNSLSPFSFLHIWFWLSLHFCEGRWEPVDTYWVALTLLLHMVPWLESARVGLGQAINFATLPLLLFSVSTALWERIFQDGPYLRCKHSDLPCRLGWVLNTNNSRRLFAISAVFHPQILLLLSGDKFRLVIASTLYEDGTLDDGEYNPTDDRPSRWVSGEGSTSNCARGLSR